MWSLGHDSQPVPAVSGNRTLEGSREFLSLVGRRPLQWDLTWRLGIWDMSVIFAISVTADHFHPLLGTQGWGAENGLI